MVPADILNKVRVNLKGASERKLVVGRKRLISDRPATRVLESGGKKFHFIEDTGAIGARRQFIDDRAIDCSPGGFRLGQYAQQSSQHRIPACFLQKRSPLDRFGLSAVDPVSLLCRRAYRAGEDAILEEDIPA
jgi:hypothetical protein